MASVSSVLPLRYSKIRSEFIYKHKLINMVSSKVVVAVLALFAVVFITDVSGIPTIGKRYDVMTGIDFVQICLNNCAQCKKMFGNYFQGQACAESCLKFKGKAIPDCEDIGSIAPFLNTFE